MGALEQHRKAPGWLLDELASAGRENLDACHVGRYDVKMDARAVDEVELLRSWGLDQSSVVVDMGCGTGQFSLAVAPACRRVVAVDVSPLMLERVLEKRDRAGIGNVEVVAGGFLTYQHTGAAADVVYSRYALHHLPDFWKALALVRIAAMLKPGGVLYLRDLIFSFEPEDAEHRIEAWLAGASEHPNLGWTRAELETHLREEYSTYSWLLEPMIEHAGFTIQSAQHSASGIYSAYTCLKA